MGVVVRTHFKARQGSGAEPNDETRNSKFESMTKSETRNSKADLPAPAPVMGLLQRFAEHADAYHAGRYNEAQLRQEFLDPLFKALGWDVDKEQGYAEAYKDVIHEDAIHVGGATRILAPRVSTIDNPW